MSSLCVGARERERRLIVDVRRRESIHPVCMGDVWSWLLSSRSPTPTAALVAVSLVYHMCVCVCEEHTTTHMRALYSRTYLTTSLSSSSFAFSQSPRIHPLRSHFLPPLPNSSSVIVVFVVKEESEEALRSSAELCLYTPCVVIATATATNHHYSRRISH